MLDNLDESEIISWVMHRSRPPATARRCDRFPVPIRSSPAQQHHRRGGHPMRGAIRIPEAHQLTAGCCCLGACRRADVTGRVADEPGHRDVQAGRRCAGRDVRQPPDPAREGGHEGEDGDAQVPGGSEAGRADADARRLRPVVPGWYQFGEGQRNYPRTPWNGWRPDPEATKGETGRFDGLWLTTSGLMELEQAGDKVKGQYARYGPVKIEGTVTGRQLDFRYHVAPQRQGLVRPEQGRQDARGRGRRRRGEFLVRLAGPPGAGVPPARPARGRQDRRWLHQEPAHLQRPRPRGLQGGRREAMADHRHPPRLEHERQGLRVVRSRRPGPTSPGIT